MEKHVEKGGKAEASSVKGTHSCPRRGRDLPLETPSS